MTSAEREYARWSTSDLLTPEERAELTAITGETERRDRFYRTLSFGTAGLRGIMGMGLNRMNVYIVRQATRAFAQVILEAGLGDKGAAVCYDCRENSEYFAREAAWVLRCCGIPVYLFSQCRPTPQLSFAVRRFGAAAGINITASHNPKEYNGYKAYWQGGAQLPPEQAERVSERMAALDPLSPRMECEDPAPCTLLGEDFDREYVDAVLRCAVNPGIFDAMGADFSVVYSAFHGVGGFIFPQVMEQAGLRQLFPVPEQLRPDGAFPTLVSPNPEEPAGFALAIALAKEKHAPVIIGTDPDSDRVAMVVRDKNGDYVPLSGNRTGALLLHYLITQKRARGTLPENPCLIKTIVTSSLSQAVAEDNGVACFNTFTGFKYMAEKLAGLESEGKYHYLMAFEESIGYMIGDHARDKDGVVAGMLLCEMAAWYAKKGMTVLDGLEALFRKYGYYAECTRSVYFPGEDGGQRMARILASLRNDPPAALGGIPVSAWRDYLPGIRHGREGDSPTEIAGSDVLYYELVGGERLVVRPSGTEPKIKLYALMRRDSEAAAQQAAQSAARGAEECILSL